MYSDQTMLGSGGLVTTQSSRINEDGLFLNNRSNKLSFINYNSSYELIHNFIIIIGDL